MIVLQKKVFFGVWNDVGEAARLENQFRTVSLSGTIHDLDSGHLPLKNKFYGDKGQHQWNADLLQREEGGLDTALRKDDADRF